MLVGTDFIFYLVDTPTGLCYYKDKAGRTQKTPITNTVIDSHLMNSPGKWMDQTLSFTRNSIYYGINRSYSEPLLFVRDGASMIREMIYAGVGVETPLTLVVFKRNPSGIPTTYNLYYKGQIDLARFNDTCTEGLQCNLMEGGIIQLLKAYEGTIFEIPCDGSIPENKKINFDGLLVEDIFNYQFVAVPITTQPYTVVPAIFLNNEGDNFGIVHNDPILEATSDGDTYFRVSNNFLYYSIAPITIRVKGFITLRNHTNAANVGMFLATSTSEFLNHVSPSKSLINNVPGEWGPATIPSTGEPNPHYVTTLKQETTYYFDQTISLDANEKLFMIINQDQGSDGIFIVSGSFQIIFNSMALPTSCWAITWYDLFRLLVKNICQAASTTNQTFNYGFQSQLLLDNLNMLITSGDALRASGDPDYQKFFNAYNLNNTPNNNIQIEYGPVIKTSLKDCFKAANVVFCGALGNELVNNVDTLFFEEMQYVFNPTDNVMSVGEFANLKVSLMNELMITGLKIGYQPQTYDQKAGKYEYNTTAEWVSNIKSVPFKITDLVSPYRADSYGMERLRAGIASAPTSTTNNDSDNSVFIVNTDTATGANDSEELKFTSLLTDFNLSTNTNIRLVQNNSMQPVNINSVTGSYLSLNNDPSIFVFAEQTLPSNPVKKIAISYQGEFSGLSANPTLGLPTDYVSIQIWISGTLYDWQTFEASGASTVINYTAPILTRSCVVGDTVFIKISSSLNATGQLDQVILNVTNNDNTPYWSTSGQDAPITAGTNVALIAMPAVNDTYLSSHGGQPSVSYGFQYYMFNSILFSPKFSYSYAVSQVTLGSITEKLSYNFFKNGVSISNIIVAADTSQLPPKTESAEFASETLKVGDVFFLLASMTNMLGQVLSVDVNFIATDILTYDLKRIQYDFLGGVPNIAMDANGNISTTVAGAAYNIEDLTPKRLLEKWSAYIRSILYNQPAGLSFCSLSKNQYLITIAGNKTYSENQNYATSAMNPAFFLPILLSGDIKTNDNFSDAQTGAANSAISGTFNGLNILGFPEHLSQKPALNETQNWQIRAAASIDLTKLFNLEYTGLNNFTMLPGTIRSATLNSVKFFPQGLTLDAKYRTPDPDLFPFKSTVSGWLNQDGYCLPWYTGYSVPLQFRANALAPITVYLCDCCGVLESTTVFTQKTSPAVIYPDTLWEGSIDLTGVDPGSYYLVVQGGTSSGAFLQSEPIDIRAVDSSDRIMLLEYSNTSNQAEMIFDTGFKAQYYLPGFNDNKAKPGFKGAFYVDQPQNIIIESGIVYRTREIHIIGIPDYEIERFLQVMMCDTVFIENVQYSLNAQEDPEIENFTKGAPKKSWKMLLRTSKSSTGVSASASGPVQDATMILTLDANAVLPNIDNNSQSTEPNIISVEITTS